jgi:hypothetical protein
LRLRLGEQAELIAPQAMSSGGLGGHTSMSARGWILFGAVSILWGIHYGLIKVALAGGVTPALLALTRTSIGARAARSRRQAPHTASSQARAVLPRACEGHKEE